MIVETRRQPRCSFSLILLRVDGAVFAAADFCDIRVTAAGLFCLRLGGRDGRQSVGFWSLEERYRSTNNSLFSLFLSVSVYRAHVIDSFIAPRPVSLVSLDCSFIYRPSLHLARINHLRGPGLSGERGPLPRGQATCKNLSILKSRFLTCIIF